MELNCEYGDLSNNIQNCKQQITIEIRNLSCNANKKETTDHSNFILKNVYAKFRPGHLGAIIGPSGAGKSTLLNILSGYRIHGTTGSILVNGQKRNLSQFRKMSCYITQDVALLPLLTTEETLLFAAEQKLGEFINKSKKIEMVNGILLVLGLIKTKNTRVQKLTSGEKKRLSIGVELVTNPPVMFFDEPTSGLDSLSSLQVISHLKSLATAGRTVICSIHQPSSKIIEVFDDIFILAEGQCLYNGPLHLMTTVFQEEGFFCPEYYNRADFAIEVARKKRGKDLEKLVLRVQKEFSEAEDFLDKNVMWKRRPDGLNSIRINTFVLILIFGEWYPLQSIQGKHNSMTKTSQKELSIEILDDDLTTKCKSFTISDLIVLTKRSVLCTYRDLYMAPVRVFTHFLIGLLIGILCYNIGNDASKALTNATCILTFLMFLFCVCPILTVLVYPMESSVVIREYHNNMYSLRTYIFSKIFSDLPMQILCPAVFLLGSYFLTDQPYDGMRFSRFLNVCLLLTMCGQSMGFVAGAAFDSQLGLFAASSFNILMFLFSGFVIRVEDVPKFIQWFSYVNYFHHSYEAAMIIIYGGNRTNLKCYQSYCRFKTPMRLLEEYNISESNYEADILALILWIIFLQLMFYFVLKWRSNKL